MTVAKTRKQMMAEWPATIREDGRRVEILCPHGVGHPVKDLSIRWEDWMGVHGCDGCCGSVEFRIAEEIHLAERKGR